MKRQEEEQEKKKKLHRHDDDSEGKGREMKRWGNKIIKTIEKWRNRR